ncbi:ABC transporter substrate-binding protein [Halalkalicoccus sp. NIPERK01]|uniref:ABC transporter substrate-binding protein n=1 Tax=Halalkalicoccus sp. NIPERK01 TaxID=3053469 RepID=UPI00256F59C8|nr:ABC transporter substrate-binding protein [Halalkalicoccus sp. NIPERK01]MDL5361504.1 ABC transporter substrate-binding protein [Halalkalicoccus sp. NIPERK01]
MPRDTAIDRRGFLKFAGASAAVATTGLAGCVGGDDDGGDPLGGDGDGDLEITVTQGTFATTVDPQDHNDTPTYNVLDQAYEPLLYRDAEGEIVEYLASDYEQVADDQVRFQLREGVSFHSGDDLTAEDVAYSINRTVDDEVGIVSPQQDGLSGVESAEAGEEGTVDVFADGPSPAMLANFASFGRIVQQSWMEEREGETIREANGTGPYQLEEFEEDVRATFTAFDDYWDADNTGDVVEVTFEGAPESSTRVNALLAGETDLITDVPPSETPRIEDEDGMYFESIASTRVIFLVMTNDRAPFDSQEFRQAMNYAVDVEGIIDELLEGFGEPTSQPTLAGHFGHDPNVEAYPHDPEQAQQLIEQSGYAGEEITLHTPTGRYLGDEEIGRAAASQIDGLENVSCDLEIRDFGDLVSEILDGEMSTSPGFYLIGWGNPTFDANYTLVPWFMPGQASYHFQNDEVEGLIEQSEAEMDEDAREGQLQEVNALLNELAPWVFLHNQYSIYGVNESLDWTARSDEDILAKDISSA